MKCQGNFKFRELKLVEAGSFVRDGQKIDYGSSYRLKVDEITEKGVCERVFKISPENQELLNIVKGLRIYDDLVIIFDIVFYNANVRLTPTSISKK